MFYEQNDFWNKMPLEVFNVPCFNVFNSSAWTIPFHLANKVNNPKISSKYIRGFVTFEYEKKTFQGQEDFTIKAQN